MTTSTELFSRRILVVDDNPSIHRDFRKILCPPQPGVGAQLATVASALFDETLTPTSGTDFQMDSAHQGQEALEKVRAAHAENRPYSLAFMDVRMPPGWDGIETTRQIWAEFPGLQVVICTAYSDYSWEDILGQVSESDNLLILKKPFDSIEVLQLAHALTKKWAVTRQANARMADLDNMVRQRTAELRSSEERFHKAFETVPIAMSIRRADNGQYLDVNQAFVDSSGYAREEIIGKTPLELNFLVVPEQYNLVSQSIAAGERIRNMEMRIRRKDGAIRQACSSVEPLQLGDFPCILAALVDVTDHRLLEEQLRKAQKMEAVGQLAAGVAHDFNNLLTVIHGYASLHLVKSHLEPDVTRALNHIKLASERASHLTRQLLAFSRKQVVRAKPLNLAHTIGHMQTMLARTLGDNIRFECFVDDALPLIKADEANLEQVLLNLILNARDAMPSGGTVRLGTGVTQISEAEAAAHPDARPGAFCTLSLSDTGCGMDPQLMSRIFEPFFTTKQIGRGTGLGLSTVYGIVKQHQGWITVQSEPAVGSTFTVFLPVTKEVPEPEVEKPPTTVVKPVPRPISNGDATILLVEDEPEVRQYVRTVLTENGYSVLEASSGAEALTMWKHIAPRVRVLLTDMVMPEGVSGSVLARQLLSSKPDLKVIYTSGYSQEVAASRQYLDEGRNFLSKPFTHESLLCSIHQALSSTERAVQLPQTN